MLLRIANFGSEGHDCVYMAWEGSQTSQLLFKDITTKREENCSFRDVFFFQFSGTGTVCFEICMKIQGKNIFSLFAHTSVGNKR